MPFKAYPTMNNKILSKRDANQIVSQEISVEIYQALLAQFPLLAQFLLE
jgi:hypothetical protein